MKITIHQSICGEKNKAWDLLKSTMPDLTVAKSLAFKTDLQEQTGGILWTPAIRGFSSGGYYLIMKTFEDTSPEVRRGRKYSHVLIIQREDIVQINDLKVILDLLFDTIHKDAPIEPLQLEIASESAKLVFEKVFQGRFNKLINGFLKIGTYLDTIIWMGQEDFEKAVTEFWKRLSYQERLLLNFGISFSKDGIEGEKINLIAVPDTIQSRFLQSGFFIIGKNDNHSPTEIIEKILIGDEQAKLKIENFGKAIGADSFSRDDINFISKGLHTFEELATVTDLKKLNTLAHIVAEYSPSENQGIEFKENLIEKIVQSIKVGIFSEIIVLRAFKWASFKNARKIISDALSEWIDNNIFTVKEKTNSYSSFFDRLTFISGNVWDEMIENKLSGFLKNVTSPTVLIIYAWFKETPTLLRTIERLIENSKNAETLFLEKLPKKPNTALIVELQKLAISRNWYRFYAKMLILQHSLQNALFLLLKVDNDDKNLEAINIILHNAKPKTIIEVAVQVGDIRLIKIAGEVLYKSPKLLDSLKVEDQNSQAIWLESLKNECEAVLKHATKHINALFEHVISGGLVSIELLEKISQTSHANIISFPNRSAFWTKLDPNIQENFLKTTSAALLEQLSQNSNTEIPGDDVLASYIIRTGVWTFLYYNRDNIKSVIPIFDKFAQLSDDNLKDYLHNYSGQINVVDATQLGKLIDRKRYVRSAEALYYKATKTNNWKFALVECHHLLDIWKKGNLAVTGLLSKVNITSDQWWQSVEDLIVELYPNGTSLTTVWKKSGGKESDLLMNVSAADVWQNVLYRLRANHFKEITMDDLLKEIKKRYGRLDKFKIVFKIRGNYIKIK